MSDIEENDYASESESESETEMDRRKSSKQVKSAIGKPKTAVLSENEDDESDVAESDSDEDISIADSKEDSDIDDIDPEEMDENAIFADVVKSKNTEDDEFQFGFNSEDDDDSDLDEDEDEDGTYYLQKLDESVKEQTIANHHPELIIHNYDEVEVLTTVVRNEYGIIVDPLHRTLPFLSKYERTRILGERAKQINDGARPFVTMDPSVIDGYLIALKELEERKLPFIIRRPLNNGGSEYWKLKDLEFII